MTLKPGYTLACLSADGQTCGNGGTSDWELRHNGQLVHTFWSCCCGRGCGGKDCVVDDWGYHDCAPEIEAVRAD